MEETSLEDFVSSDRATSSGAEAESDVEDDPSMVNADDGDESRTPGDVGAEAGAADMDAGDEDPERPAVTATWSTDAEPCAECGEPSAWRWAHAAAMVCPACKEW